MLKINLVVMAAYVVMLMIPELLVLEEFIGLGIHGSLRFALNAHVAYG